jgi:hypothetical protein
MTTKPVQYPAGSTASRPTPPKKPRGTLKTIMVAVGVLVIIAAAIPIAVIVSVGISCTSSNIQQQKRVKDQQAGLGRLTFLNDQKTITSGQRGGDCLTGGASSAEATATFSKVSSAIDAETEVRQNLEQQGYRQSEPLDVTGTNTSAKHSLRESYTKASITLSVIYSFAAPYECAGTLQPCSGNRDIPASDPVLQVSIKTIDVSYHDASIQ